MIISFRICRGTCVKDSRNLADKRGLDNYLGERHST